MYPSGNHEGTTNEISATITEEEEEPKSGSRPTTKSNSDSDMLESFPAIDSSESRECQDPIACVGLPGQSTRRTSPIFQRIFVAARMRPILASDEHQRLGLVSMNQETSTVTIKQPGDGGKGQNSSLRLDMVLDSTSDQKDVFVSIGIPLVRSVLTGFDACLIMYGQTGSGKTYTLQGNGGKTRSRCSTYYKQYKQLPEDVGLVQRCVEMLLRAVHSDREGVASVTVSYLQIYNEAVYDLLGQGQGLVTGLAIHCSGGSSGSTEDGGVDGDGVGVGVGAGGRSGALSVGAIKSTNSQCSSGVVVEGLSEFNVSNMLDAMKLFDIGNANRKMAATKMNRKSSRSHTIFTVTVVRSQRLPPRSANGKKEELINTKSKLVFVDLAGSENLKRSECEGVQAVETQYINRSLTALGIVVASLSDQTQPTLLTLDYDTGFDNNNNNNSSTSGRLKKDKVPLGTHSGGRSVSPTKHIPFRDSKLTRLLQPYLSGSSLVNLVLTLSPTASNLSHTKSTLLFGQRAMSISVHPMIRYQVDYKKLTRQMKRELDETHGEVVDLRREVRRVKEWGEDIEKRYREVVRRNEDLERQRQARLLEETMGTSTGARSGAVGRATNNNDAAATNGVNDSRDDVSRSLTMINPRDLINDDAGFGLEDIDPEILEAIKDINNSTKVLKRFREKGRAAPGKNRKETKEASGWMVRPCSEASGFDKTDESVSHRDLDYDNNGVLLEEDEVGLGDMLVEEVSVEMGKTQRMPVGEEEEEEEEEDAECDSREGGEEDSGSQNDNQYGGVVTAQTKGRQHYHTKHIDSGHLVSKQQRSQTEPETSNNEVTPGYSPINLSQQNADPLVSSNFTVTPSRARHGVEKDIGQASKAEYDTELVRDLDELVQQTERNNKYLHSCALYSLVQSFLLLPEDDSEYLSLRDRLNQLFLVLGVASIDVVMLNRDFGALEDAAAALNLKPILCTDVMKVAQAVSLRLAEVFIASAEKKTMVQGLAAAMTTDNEYYTTSKRGPRGSTTDSGRTDTDESQPCSPSMDRYEDGAVDSRGSSANLARAEYSFKDQVQSDSEDGYNVVENTRGSSETTEHPSNTTRSIHHTGVDISLVPRLQVEGENNVSETPKQGQTECDPLGCKEAESQNTSTASMNNTSHAQHAATPENKLSTMLKNILIRVNEEPDMSATNTKSGKLPDKQTEEDGVLLTSLVGRDGRSSSSPDLGGKGVLYGDTTPLAAYRPPLAKLPEIEGNRFLSFLTRDNTKGQGRTPLLDSLRSISLRYGATPPHSSSPNAKQQRMSGVAGETNADSTRPVCYNQQQQQQQYSGYNEYLADRQKSQYNEGGEESRDRDEEMRSVQNTLPQTTLEMYQPSHTHLDESQVKGLHASALNIRSLDVSVNGLEPARDQSVNDLDRLTAPTQQSRTNLVPKMSRSSSLPPVRINSVPQNATLEHLTLRPNFDFGTPSVDVHSTTDQTDRSTCVMDIIERTRRSLETMRGKKWD